MQFHESLGINSLQSGINIGKQFEFKKKSIDSHMKYEQQLVSSVGNICLFKQEEK